MESVFSSAGLSVTIHLLWKSFQDKNISVPQFLWLHNEDNNGKS